MSEYPCCRHCRKNDEGVCKWVAANGPHATYCPDCHPTRRGTYQQTLLFPSPAPAFAG